MLIDHVSFTGCHRQYRRCVREVRPAKIRTNIWWAQPSPVGSEASAACDGCSEVKKVAAVEKIEEKCEAPDDFFGYRNRNKLPLSV